MVLFLYAYTTPRLVGLEDDGLFISNLHFFGVAHPPGYPIHTFLGGIFYHLLPFGTPAFKGHFFSGFVGAIACAAIYATVAMLLTRTTVRLFGRLGLRRITNLLVSGNYRRSVYAKRHVLFYCACLVGGLHRSHRPSGRSHRRLFCALTFCLRLGVGKPLSDIGSWQHRFGFNGATAIP